MKIRICTTSYRRPQYLREVLQGLVACPGSREFETYHFVDRVVGQPQIQRNIMDAIADSGVRNDGIFRHQRNAGCSQNIGSALQFGFSDPSVDAVIMLEDDTVPSEDFLEFMVRSLEQYQLDDSVGSITGYSRRFLEHRPKGRFYAIGEGDPLGVVRTKGLFCCWGWATWRRFYQKQIEPNWNQRVYATADSWDVVMKREMHQGFHQIRPDMSRIQNIGAEQGQYCPGRWWNELHQKTYCWMGDGIRRPNLLSADPGPLDEVIPEVFSAGKPDPKTLVIPD